MAFIQRIVMESQKCERCGAKVLPEHAHEKCPKCGWLTSCCEGNQAQPDPVKKTGVIYEQK